MAHDGREIANFVLDLCHAKGRKVSNLSLQKIVYFCHVWSLVNLNKPLIKQQFEAWEYGPVLPYLYREFKIFDRSPIETRATKLDPVTGGNRIVDYDFDEATRHLVASVVDFYSRVTAGDLVELSHAKGGPWFNVWHHQTTVNPGMKIYDADIRGFYSKISGPFIAQ